MLILTEAEVDALIPPEAARALALAAYRAQAALRAMAAAFRLLEIRVCSRSFARTESLAADAAELAPRVDAVADAAQAVRDADLMLRATSAEPPVFPGEAVRDGAVDALGKGDDIRLALAGGALDASRWRGEIGFLDATLAVDGCMRVFKCIGIAVRDLLLARRVVARAEAEGMGLQHTIFGDWESRL